MHTWTEDEQGAWTCWEHPVLALDALATLASEASEASEASLRSRVRRVVFVETDLVEDPQIIALIRLTKRLDVPHLTVMAAHAHPTAAWAESVRAAGADQAWFLPKPNGARRENLLAGAEALTDGICPYLHARHTQGGTLSVCGQHHDRMVLARSHFDHWCLHPTHPCPHRRDCSAYSTSDVGAVEAGSDAIAERGIRRRRTDSPRRSADHG